METLSGSVERVTFYNPENGYSVIRLRPERAFRGQGLGRDGTVTIVGNLPELTAGEQVKLQGRWASHAKHGVQFQVEICEQTVPATVSGIRRYLGSGLIKGIGPKLADRIVQAFGAQTMDVIDSHPERLREVPDIGPVRSGVIAAAWVEQKQVKEIMLFLHSHAVSTNLAVKIYKTYADQALWVVKNDPYRLARDIYGVGFKTADKLAQALGLPVDHPSRIEAGIVYVLNQMTDDGHVYAPLPLLVEESAELLGVDPGLLPAAVERLAKDDRVRQELIPFPRPEDIGNLGVLGSEAAQNTQISGFHSPSLPASGGEMGGRGDERGSPSVREPSAPFGQQAVYLTPLYLSETGVAERLRRLADAPAHGYDVSRLGLEHAQPALSDEQQSAIRTALTHPVSVLTGGPGTGKTTAIQALIAAVEAARRPYALASPTGRAAKRLSEATGRPASTIHRLLGPSPAQGFKYNSQNPLPIDLLVVDEASMLDLSLANNLLKALRPGTHLLLVGDVDQLPSVGAGDVLRDVIDSGAAPLTRLSAIFRQAAGSHIITNAHRINHGEMPIFVGAARGPTPAEASRDAGSPLQSGDFFLFPAEAPEEAGNWVQEVVCLRIPQKFGYDPQDIQVLAPMYRGPAGVTALNQRLQQALNPPSPLKPEKALYGQVFRPGDRVMQTQNNYDKDAYNGDIGRVLALDPIEHALMVDFDGRQVTYDWSECDQLVLAYAVSVHKGQGSEFPVVVIPLVTSHYMMLQRNLLYTAVTRAKKLCVLVGSRKAIGIAVKNDKVAHRYTALDWRLKAKV
jgi:exodeoxyribonuclease V alpha subunit